MPASGVDYLTTLGVVSTLLLSELDNEGSDYKWSDPPWMAVVTTFIAQSAWFFILTSIIGSIITVYLSVKYGYKCYILSQTLLLASGIFLYMIELCIDYYVEAFDKKATLPNDEGSKLTTFLINSIPVWLFLITCPIYIFSLTLVEIEDNTPKQRLLRPR
jgi:hypothetical protein